jgi:signal peptidase I
MITKINELAAKISFETREEFLKRGFTLSCHEASFVVKVVPGKKYTKVDVGSSGKYMITEDGDIYGIKAYGVIHKGHHYGTVDTINEWYWGSYTAEKLKLKKTVTGWKIKCTRRSNNEVYYAYNGSIYNDEKRAQFEADGCNKQWPEIKYELEEVTDTLI